MLGETRDVDGFERIEAGPMPDSITRAVARRRQTIRARRGAAVAGCLAIAGVVAVWWAQPPGGSITPVAPIADATPAEPGGVRFAPVSVLALRMGDADGSWPALPAAVGTERADLEPLLDLRRRALSEPALPAS